MSRFDNGELMARKFTVRVNEIKAAMLFASNDETRFVLNGVLFEVHERSAPVMVTTDGRRLAVIESVSEQTERADLDFNCLLSCAFLKPLCAFAKTQASEILFEFRPTERILARFLEGKCSVDCERGAVIDGTYPNWRQVLPVGEKQFMPTIGVNANYIGDFAKAAKLLECTSPIIAVNLIGNSHAMEIKITERPQFYGVLMPAHVDEKQEWQPHFVGFEPPAPVSEPVQESDQETVGA